MKKITATVFAVAFLFLFSSLNERNNKIDVSSKTVLGFVSYKIFGPVYAKIPIYSNALGGHVYYIVGGHGGPDPGAIVQKNGNWLCEDEYAYDVSLRLARNLISHGAKVYVITRDENDGIRDDVYLVADKDETVWGGEAMPLNQKKRLQQRTDLINKLYEENKQRGFSTQRMIETHIDSRYSSQKVDIFFYHKSNSNEGKSLAKNMFQTIKVRYDAHQKDRGYSGVVTSRDLWMVRESKPTAIYIELGNIANEFDQRRLLIPDNRQAIANWLAAGILDNI
jgi:N-acetylmuramoyl-L-alanine amidase